MTGKGCALVCALLAFSCEKHSPSEATGPASASALGQSSAAAPSAPSTALRVVARSNAPTALFTLGDSVFVVSGKILYRVDERGLHQDIALQRGFAGTIPEAPATDSSSYELAGNWPDAAWLQAFARVGDSSEPAIVATYRWVVDRWQRVGVLGENETLLGVSSWRKGSALALVGSDAGLRLLLANNRGSLDLAPTATPSANAADGGASDRDGAPEAEDAAIACRTLLRGHGLGALRAFDSGHVFIAGTSSSDGEDSWQVERFVPGKKKSTIDTVPRAGGTARPVMSLLGRAPDRVFLLVREEGLLYAFDGASWRRETLPASGRLSDAAVSKQGTLWIVQGGGVYRRPEGKSFERVEIGEPVASELAVATDDAPFIVARRGEVSELIALAAPGAVIELPALGRAGDIVRFPASAVCETPYVLIAEHVKPNASEFPEISKKLSGLRGVELSTETSQKWTYLGARVPSLELARTLIERLRGVEGAKPALYCHEPRVKRRIALE